MICMPRLLDMHIENAQTGPIHAPKTANINEKLNSLQHLKLIWTSAELKQKISQKMILVRSTVTFRQCAAK